MDLSWKDANKIEHWIPLDQCKDGYLYSIAARNATLGIYRSAYMGFEIRRVKGNVFRFVEDHWDRDEHGTAKPLAEIERAPELLSEEEFIRYIEERFATLSQGGAP